MSGRVETLEGLGRAHPRRVALPREAHPNALVWFHGQLIDLSALPGLTRPEAWYFYRLRRMPRAGAFYDIRGSYPSREWARAQIEPGDPLGYVVAVPFGRSLGSEVSESPYFCRPYHADYAELDAEHARLYTDDLRETWHEEVSAKVQAVEALLELACMEVGRLNLLPTERRECDASPHLDAALRARAAQEAAG